jgi:hypothetical protein
VAPDPKDETLRVLAVSKSNLGPIPPSLSYRIVQASAASMIEWVGIADSTANDLLVAQGSEAEPAGARADAEGFLQDLLAEGPVAAKDAHRQARDVGISSRTLARARVSLGVKTSKHGGRFGGDPGWYWELPAPEDAKPPEDANRFWVAPSGKLASSGGREATVLAFVRPADPPDQAVYHHLGHDYRPGDTLPDGRVVESIDAGIPVLLKAKVEPPEEVV